MYWVCEAHRARPRDCSARIHDGSAYFAGQFRRGAAARTFLSWPRRWRGPIGCFQFSVGAPEGRLDRHTGFSLVPESGMNRDGRIAEWTGGRESARTKRGHERKRSIETGERGGRAGGRGRRRRRRRKASASNADIRHTTSNAGAARWRLDRPTLKTPVDQP